MFLSYFQSSSLAKKYSLIDLDKDQKYRNVFICKNTPDSFGIFEIPTKMNRSAPYITIKEDDKELKIFNLHLESYLEDGHIRVEQLRSIITECDQSERILICGDMNFGDFDFENKFVNSNLQDAGVNSSIFTYDIESNKIAQKTHFENEGSRRLDRFLFKRGLKCSNYSVLESPYSDHFPISLNVEI